MGKEEEAELEKQLPDWAVQDLDNILGYTAPEIRRFRLLDLMINLVMAADDTADVG